MKEVARASWLGARNPTVKMAVLLAVSVAVLFLFDPLPLLVMYAASLLGARWAAGIRWGMLLRAQVPFVVFAGGVFVVNALSRPGEQIFDAPVRITVEGVVVGAALALRALVIGLGAVAVTASTDPRAMMVSAVQHARVPPRYAYALLAGQRTLEAMPRTWATIRAAQAVRAPIGRDGMPKHGAAAFGRASFALLVDAVRSSERIALALESRGLGDRPRTLWRPVPIGSADAVLAVVVAVVLIVIIVGWMLLR